MAGDRQSARRHRRKCRYCPRIDKRNTGSSKNWNMVSVASTIVDIVKLAEKNHRKTNLENIKDWVQKLKKFCAATFFEERNIILENAQIGVLRVADRLISAIENANNPKYSKSIPLLETIQKHFKVSKLIASITIHDILQDLKEYSN